MKRLKHKGRTWNLK